MTGRRPGGAPRCPRLLLVFPSTSVRIMAGSIGELTALVRLARGLSGGRFEVRYAELLRAADPHPRVDGLLRRLGGSALLDGEPEGATVPPRALAPAADVIVLASFRAFFQYPKLPRLIPMLLASWQAAGIRLVALDPCGDSFVSPMPPGVAVLLPRPFTYGEAPRDGQMVFSAGEAPRGGQVMFSAGETPGGGQVVSAAGAAAGGSRRQRRWLWAAAPWMLDFSCFRAAERLALLGLSRLAAVEVSVLSPLDPTLPPLARARRIAEDLDYQQLEAEVARHDLLITANCRSVLAARAAAMGIPLALVDPLDLPAPGGHDPVTDELLRAAAAEQLPGAPLPIEFRKVPCGDPAGTAAAFVAVQRDLAAMRDLQRQRSRDYRRLPDALACIEQILG